MHLSSGETTNQFLSRSRAAPKSAKINSKLMDKRAHYRSHVAAEMRASRAPERRQVQPWCLSRRSIRRSKTYCTRQRSWSSRITTFTRRIRSKCAETSSQFWEKDRRVPRVRIRLLPSSSRIRRMLGLQTSTPCSWRTTAARAARKATSQASNKTSLSSPPQPPMGSEPQANKMKLGSSIQWLAIAAVWPEIHLDRNKRTVVLSRMAHLTINREIYKLAIPRMSQVETRTRAALRIATRLAMSTRLSCRETILWPRIPRSQTRKPPRQLAKAVWAQVKRRNKATEQAVISLEVRTSLEAAAPRSGHRVALVISTSHLVVEQETVRHTWTRNRRTTA